MSEREDCGGLFCARGYTQRESFISGLLLGGRGGRGRGRDAEMMSFTPTTTNLRPPPSQPLSSLSSPSFFSLLVFVLFLHCCCSSSSSSPTSSVSKGPKLGLSRLVLSRCGRPGQRVLAVVLPDDLQLSLLSLERKRERENVRCVCVHE